MNILQSNPKAGYLAHQSEIEAAIDRVLASGWFILGKETAAFEEEFARFVGALSCIGVANGTDALTIALRACGVGPGDAVLTVSHTAVATVAAIELAGAVPVLVDIDPDTWTLSPESLEETLRAWDRLPLARNSRPKAIVAVHLYGHPADLPALKPLAERHGLVLVEDCAQSHGATLDGRMTGTWGRAAAFSFYPTKNLGALGDGGAVLTNDLAVAERARLCREYGWRERYVSETAGMNSRLDEMQSAILRVKLEHLAAENEVRRQVAARYDQQLAGCGLALPRESPAAKPVYHQFVIGTPKRDALKSYLKERGIGTLIHYPVPVHLQPAYKGRLPLAPGGLPHTENAARTVLSLPIYPQLPSEQVDRVAAAISAWCAGPVPLS